MQCRHPRLVRGQRYWFTIEGARTFRANFLDILHQTLRVTQHEQDLAQHLPTRNESCVWTLPLEWITRVQTLETVTQHQLCLPADIVHVVDNYV